MTNLSIVDRYKLFGKDSNDRYLQAAANMLQLNKQILAGDLSLLIANCQQRQIEIAVKDAQCRERERIYTCEYDCNLGGLYYESDSIDDIRAYLRSGIHDGMDLSNIVVSDWVNNIISFSTLD